MLKAAFNNKKKNRFTRKLDISLWKKLVRSYIWGMVAETWTLRKGDEKYLESFEIWCSSRMEMIV